MLFPLSSSLLLTHSLLKIRKYDLAARICEGVLPCDRNASEAAILLACCEAGLQEYAICNRILQAVCEAGNDHLVENVEAALISRDGRQGLTEPGASGKAG